MLIALLLIVTLIFQVLAYISVLTLGIVTVSDQANERIRGSVYLVVLMTFSSLCFWGVLLSIVGGWF